MRFPTALALAALLAACAAPGQQEQRPEPIRDAVLTEQEQAALTPHEVVATLREGNRRFVEDDLTTRDHSTMVRLAADAQYPKAIVLSCVDSRVPVEDVFDRGIGDIFVARVAGNFVNQDILGSMEFACGIAGSKLILVLGHEHCGAIKAAIDGVDVGNITALLENLQPAVEATRNAYPGIPSSSNPEFVHEVCEVNVRETIAAIRERSPMLAELEQEEQIGVVGAIYDMDTGRVTFLDDAR